MISKILICIPTYNRTKSLIDCIKSIKKLKNNKFFDIQILIVDNSINNNSYKVVKKFNILIKMNFLEAQKFIKQKEYGKALDVFLKLKNTFEMEFGLEYAIKFT